MTDTQIVIAGGGIGGLALSLSLQQIGVSCMVLESATEMRPLGVGINIQPNAVRELYDMGIGQEFLDEVGVSVEEWALVGLNGKAVYAEPRGTHAGYHWPQYAAHRGQLHMLLYSQLVARAGGDAVQLGTKLEAHEKQADGSVFSIATDKNGQRQHIKSQLLIGADGIHSSVRSQMHPDQPPIHWGGAIMWCGTVTAKPLRTQSSFSDPEVIFFEKNNT